MNFSETMFYENYLTWDFHTNWLLFQACLPTRQNGVENRDKAYSSRHRAAKIKLIKRWTKLSAVLFEK